MVEEQRDSVRLLMAGAAKGDGLTCDLNCSDVVFNHLLSEVVVGFVFEILESADE